MVESKKGRRVSASLHLLRQALLRFDSNAELVIVPHYACKASTMGHENINTGTVFIPHFNAFLETPVYWPTFSFVVKATVISN